MHVPVLVHACIVPIHACIVLIHACTSPINTCTLHVPAIIAGQSGLLWYSTDYERGHGNTLIVDCQSNARFICFM